jgi:hypothetical protein
VDDLINAYIQTVLGAVAIDKLSSKVVKNDKFNLTIFKSLNKDTSFMDEFFFLNGKKDILLEEYKYEIENKKIEENKYIEENKNIEIKKIDLDKNENNNEEKINLDMNENKIKENNDEKILINDKKND